MGIVLYCIPITQRGIIMSSLRKLTAGQLEKMLDDAKSEIKRRKNIEAAAVEIQALLDRYGVSLKDIKLQSLNRKNSMKDDRTGQGKPKKKDNRQHVRHKYSNPNGEESWSGRGHAPAWVLEICQKEGIDLATFKKNKQCLKS